MSNDGVEASPAAGRDASAPAVATAAARGDGSRRRRRARRPALAAVALAAVALVAAGAGAYLVASSGRPAAIGTRRQSGAPSPIGAPLLDAAAGRVAATRLTLTRELRAQALHLTDVACVENGRSFEGVPIVRCNVDFGDPHIEAYCTIARRGRLVTNFEDAAIPCGHDNAGFQIISYPPGLGRTSATANN